MQLRPSLKFVKLAYVFSLVLAVALAVYYFAVQDHPSYTVYGFAVPAILLLLTMMRHIRKRLAKITIMGDKLRYESGLFAKSTRTVELVKVQDVRVDQTIWQRMFGIGDLSLETAGGSSRIEMDGIDRPQEAVDHILELARTHRANPSTGASAGV